MHVHTKRNFLVLGFLNFFITNIILQILLLISSISIATFISQLTNITIGYFLYGKFVFLVQNKNFKNFLKYFLIALLTWQLNYFSINFLYNQLSFNKNIAAILMIPILTLISFLAQKYYVFAKK